MHPTVRIRSEGRDKLDAESGKDMTGCHCTPEEISPCRMQMRSNWWIASWTMNNARQDLRGLWNAGLADKEWWAEMSDDR